MVLVARFKHSRTREDVSAAPGGTGVCAMGPRGGRRMTVAGPPPYVVFDAPWAPTIPESVLRWTPLSLVSRCSFEVRSGRVRGGR